MPGHGEALYEFGPIRIDSAKRRLERGGEEAAIPPRAFDALLLLIQHHGEVVSKEDLLSKIWPDTQVEEANLPVMISSIRRAIGDDGRHQKYIQTVSKSGYRFVGEVRAVCAEEPVSREMAEAATEAPVTPPVIAGPHRKMLPWPGLKGRYTRFTLAAGGAVAACVALFLVYWLVSGSTVAGYVKAASRAVGVPPAPPSAERGGAGMWWQKGRY